ncbi:MAG: purine-binding chemotaxis protein CheW [Gammaproteobacteria bacterium]|nr:MAG: purine-binding chemotaxis protein CheW [Gammaproteobacteria bacterium]
MTEAVDQKTSKNESAEANEVVDLDACQYLSFELDQEYYCVDILRVQEILGYNEMTRVPNTPEFVKGVLNLRGAIVPVIDLRARFSLSDSDLGKTTVIVVLSIKTATKDKIVGIIVDAVSDVLNIIKTDIKSVPETGTKVETEFLTGLVSSDNRMVMIMNVDNLLDPENFMELAV